MDDGAAATRAGVDRFGAPTGQGAIEGGVKGGRARALVHGIAGQLLLCTIGFFLLAQVLVYPLAITAHRNDWISGRASSAELATLAAQSTPSHQLGGNFGQVFLSRVHVLSIKAWKDGKEEVLLEASPEVDQNRLVPVSLTGPKGLLSAPATLAHFIGRKDRQLVVSFQPKISPYDAMEIRVPEADLRDELIRVSSSILLNSLSLSAVAGVLLYITVYRLVVRPVRGLTRSVLQFSETPEAATIDLPAATNDETRMALAAVQAMHRTVSAAFRQRKRLADLGEAVAKISHDLRNSLSAAQVLSEGLADSADPNVRDAAPRLERAIRRSITLAESTLRYGRAETPVPNIQRMMLRPTLTEAAAEGGASWPGVSVGLSVGDAEVLADPDHLHRIITNLVRNAVKAAVENPGRTEPPAVRLTARRIGSFVAVEIEDNGGGVAPRIQEKLFQPFVKSGSSGGSGLGLAIARELAKGMGGDVDLVATGPKGSCFELRLPAALAA